MRRIPIPQLQKGWLSGLFILTLLVTACQPALEPDRLLTQETAISQAATAASPTASPTPTVTPSPTSTPSPTTTPTLARTSLGDQLPTRSPTSPPTPTAIPAEEPVPAPIATRPLATPTLTQVNEVDLPALEESLALLDRLERRQGKPTLTPVRPIIYEGGVVSYMETNRYCFCPGCDKNTFSAEIFMGADGTITGKFHGAIYDTNTGFMPLAGTVNSVTGVAKNDPGLDQSTDRVQAKLVDNGQKFEGTLDNTYTSDPYGGVRHECGSITTFSLDRK